MTRHVVPYYWGKFIFFIYKHMCALQTYFYTFFYSRINKEMYRNHKEFSVPEKKLLEISNSAAKHICNDCGYAAIAGIYSRADMP